MKKNNQTHHHYAIRKFTVGAGSTLIASFIFMGLSTSAYAEESTQTHHETQVEAEHTQENEQLLPSKDITTAQQVETQPDFSTKRSETQTNHVNTPSSEKIYRNKILLTLNKKHPHLRFMKDHKQNKKNLIIVNH